MDALDRLWGFFAKECGMAFSPANVNQSPVYVRFGESLSFFMKEVSSTLPCVLSSKDVMRRLYSYC